MIGFTEILGIVDKSLGIVRDIYSPQKRKERRIQSIKENLDSISKELDGAKLEIANAIAEGDMVSLEKSTVKYNRLIKKQDTLKKTLLIYEKESE